MWLVVYFFLFGGCLCGSGVSVVSGGCVTTAVFVTTALCGPYRLFTGGVSV
jgi:hypothetical protein